MALQRKTSKHKLDKGFFLHSKEQIQNLQRDLLTFIISHAQCRKKTGGVHHK